VIWTNYLTENAFAQEIRMRKALTMIMAAAILGVGFQAMSGPPETIAEGRMIAAPVQKGMSINGLRVALPEHMTNFPKELVPLP